MEKVYTYSRNGKDIKIKSKYVKKYPEREQLRKDFVEFANKNKGLTIRELAENFNKEKNANYSMFSLYNYLHKTEEPKQTKKKQFEEFMKTHDLKGKTKKEVFELYNSDSAIRKISYSQLTTILNFKNEESTD